MDLATVAGLFTAFAMMGGSLLVMGMEGKGAVNYGAFIDPPAIMMVIGGALGVGLVGFPLRNVLGLPKVILKVFFSRPENLNHLIEQLVGLAKAARRDGLLTLESKVSEIDDPFLALGIQMVVDGTRPEVVEEVMRTEISAMGARHREGKKVLQLIGRCGPAFGMIATLLGLVLMLGNLSDPDSIGPSMAVALIGTLYGALMANLVCIPFTEKLSIRSHQEMIAKEITLVGIMGIQSGDNPRTVQQKLNTYLPPKMRLTEKLAIRLHEETIASEIAVRGIGGIQSGDNPRTVQLKLNANKTSRMHPGARKAA
jgi:chemotaxis protein MotA